jgi:hypothetical protein
MSTVTLSMSIETDVPSWLALFIMLFPYSLTYDFQLASLSLDLFTDSTLFQSTAPFHGCTDTRDDSMCILNYSPFEDEDEGPDYPLPRGRPRLAWAIPVSMSELAASLQAITETMPQTTALRLCHRFRDSPLSKLPQEILDHVIDDVERAARVDLSPQWHQDSICWQGTCLPEDHYSWYGEHVERLWQKFFIDRKPRGINRATLRNKTSAEKAEMVYEWMMGDPELYESEDGYSLHIEAKLRWVERTCLCLQASPRTSNFIELNNVS